MNNLHSTLRRRQFLTEAVGGVGLAGMAGLLSVGDLMADPFAVKAPHFPAKAKNLIFLYMEGAPSQIDLLDPKPALAKWHGQPLPPSMTKDMKFAFIKPNAKVLGCNRSFGRYGQSGAEFSDWISAWGPIADDLCIVRSMHTDAFNHQPADQILFTGHMLGFYLKYLTSFFNSYALFISLAVMFQPTRLVISSRIFVRPMYSAAFWRINIFTFKCNDITFVNILHTRR